MRKQKVRPDRLPYSHVIAFCFYTYLLIPHFYISTDHAQLDDEEGKGDDVVKKTSTNVDIENLRVIADINVKFITLCNINLPRRDGGDDKKWKMMRVFKWTFSSDINKGRDGLDWKISEVSASGWN